MHKLAVVLLVGVALGPCSKKESPPAPSTATATVTSSTAATNTATATATATAKAAGPWKSFEPKGMGISVELPGDPKEEVNDVEAAGVKGKQHLYSAKYGGSFYNFNVQQFPPTTIINAAKGLAGARDAMLKEGATLVSETDVKLAGKHPGKELELKLTKPGAASMSARAYVVGKKIIIMLVLTPGSSGTSDDAKRFFDSLKV